MASSKVQILSGTTSIPLEEGFYIIDNSLISGIITFPDAILMKGKLISVSINTDIKPNKINTVTYIPFGNQKIGGLFSLNVTSLNVRFFISDGNNWY